MLNLTSSKRRAATLAIFSTILLTTPLSAQWVKYPTAGAPRKTDGSVDMSAPAAKVRGGKADLAGTGTRGEVDPRRALQPRYPHDATTSRRMVNIGVELQGGLPYQPWLATLVKERTA